MGERKWSVIDLTVGETPTDGIGLLRVVRKALVEANVPDAGIERAMRPIGIPNAISSHYYLVNHKYTLSERYTGSVEMPVAFYSSN
jgi:hypothetical protein